MAALIFASWFHLVAQVQTFISIFLLAIIGFFLGKVTDHNAIRRSESSQPAYELSDELKKVKKWKGIDENATMKSIKSTAEIKNLSILSLNSRNSKRKLWKRKQEKDFAATKLVHSGSLDDDVSSQTTHTIDNTSTLDPLIRRANSALNLLKALNSSSNSSIGGEEGEVDEQSLLSPSLINEPMTSTSSTATNNNNTPTTIQLRNNKPLTSPSISCSSNSTGYNSDTRSTTNPTRTATPPSRVSIADIIHK